MAMQLFLMLLAPAATGALLLLLAGVAQQRTARWIALGGTLVTLGLSLGMVSGYRHLVSADASPSGAAAAVPMRLPFEWRHPWLTLQGGADASSAAAESTAQPLKLEFHLGLDGVSVAMILLTTLLCVSCVLISWEAIKDRESEFYAALLILESAVLGVFCAFDALLFYVFFEFTLIPLFFLIAIWGGPQRRYAAVKFFLYTLSGGLITLLGLVTLVGAAAAGGLATPASLPDLAAWLQNHPLPGWLQVALFLAISAGLLVKVPVFPFHTWLPLAHVEAPTAGSVLLAGVLLKLGTYGFLRLCLPMLPYACWHVGLPLIAILSVVGIVYGSLCALVQQDVKKLVAYSSVAHLGFCMLGLFALNVEGISGGVLQMVNHGLSTGALFLLVGMIYDRFHTRMFAELGGLSARLPLVGAAMVFIAMASAGLPGLNGFVGELLCLGGMFRRWTDDPRCAVYASLAATGVVLGAWYMLSMLQGVFFGPVKHPAEGDHPSSDMSFREALAVAPLAAACLWIGVRPQPLTDLIQPEAAAIARLYETPPRAPAEAPDATVQHASQQADGVAATLAMSGSTTGGTEAGGD